MRHALVAVCISLFVAGVLGLIGMGGRGSGQLEAPPLADPAAAGNVDSTSAASSSSAGDKAVGSSDLSPAAVSSATATGPPIPSSSNESSSNKSSSSTLGSKPAASSNKPLAEQLASLASAAADTAASKAGATAQDLLEDGYIAVTGCTPATGPELQYLVENSTCPIITLTPGTKYVLDNYMTVRRPVMVLGRPLTLPIIDAHMVYRAFLVEAGGLLDLRFVEVWRGMPVEVVPGYYYEIRGGVAWVRAGGVGLFTGCLMVFHEDAVGDVFITRAPQVTFRIYGGFLLLEVGTLRVLDCHMLLQTPGVLVREVYTVGGYVLVVAGNAVITGCSFTASFVFINVFGVGNFLCVLGGNAIVTGTVFTLNAAFVASQGIGILLFIGVGTSIFTGCTTQGNVGFFYFFGAGLGLFTGGGVSVLTGMVFGSVVIMNFGAGIGMNNALGAGVMVKTGVVQYGTVALTSQAALGTATFVGAGAVVYTDCVWTRVSCLASAYGAGGSLYLGAGVATVTNCASMAIAIIVIAAAAGGDHCVMAGWLTMVNHIFFKWVTIAAYYGQGVDTCLVAGGALLVNCRYTGTPALVSVSYNLYNVYIAGNFIILNDTTDVVLATHRHYRIWDTNKTKERNRMLPGATTGKGWSNELPSGRWLEEEEEEEMELEPSEESYPVMKRGPESSLFMRHVSWTEMSLKEVKATLKEATGGSMGGGMMGRSSNWPQQTFRQLHHPPRRVLADDGEAMPPVVNVALLQTPLTPSRIDSADVFNSSLYMPLAPLSPILVPAPDPAHVTTNKVFLGTRLGGCQACDVTGPGFAGGAQSASTGALFNGQGEAGCDFREACNPPADEEEEEGSMWMSYPDKGIQPNTTLAVIELRATYTPSMDGKGLESAHVLTAVNQTMQRLGLSQRLHLRVVADDPTTPYPREEDEAARRLQEELAEANVPCSATAPFRAYVVTDQKPVAAQVTKGLRQAAATTHLTDALQAQDPSACRLAATVAWTLHVPSLNASKLMEGVPGTEYVSKVLGSAAEAMPQRSSSNDGPLHSQQLQQPTAAVLSVESGEEENQDTARLAQIVMGQTYRVALGHFPKGRLLSIRLVPKAGPSTLLGMVGSTGPDAKPQEWTWAVSTTKHAAGEHFLEVTSQAKDAFAYSQAFELLLPKEEDEDEQ